MALICCENVVLGYDGKKIAENLNFTVNAGDYLCVVGENGSGKSTLMKALLGLKAPLGGKITMAKELRGSQIGYLPQRTETQRDFPASVWEVVLSGCLGGCGLRPFYSPAQKQKARNNMEKLGVSNLAKRCFRELSGGQQQRVLLARALCATQKLLLLDEPVAGLDPAATEEMYAIIQKLNDEGVTILMVSHDLTAALSHASHILHVGHTQQFFGSRESYLQSPVGRQYFAQMGGERHV